MLVWTGRSGTEARDGAFVFWGVFEPPPKICWVCAGFKDSNAVWVVFEGKMPSPRGRAALVRGTGAGEGQPGARGENRAGGAPSQRGAALSCKGSGAGCLMTSHQLARGAEVFPSRLSRAKINKTRRETALAPRCSREIGRGTTERPPQPGVSVGSSWERGSLLEILLQGSEKGFFWGRAPSVEKRVPQLPLVRNGVKNQEQELGWVPRAQERAGNLQLSPFCPGV